MKIYVASSWRNQRETLIVEGLRKAGCKVYDFKNSSEGDNGFGWREIDKDWQHWSSSKFRSALSDPVAEKGFKSDFDAMKWAEVFVLVMPCGRSAHLELGWAVGAGKRTIILLSDGEPELMYKMVDYLCVDFVEVLKSLEKIGSSL